MFTESHQESSRSAAVLEEAERKARADLADPDIGSPEQGDTSTDNEPPD